MLFDIELFHRNDIDISIKHKNRIAVRAVIINGNSITMAYLKKNNEYKFPGGGVNQNETMEEALKREIKEEIGASLKLIKRKLGIVTEYDKQDEDKNEYFRMESHYYEVEIDSEIREQELDEYEKELEYVMKVVNIEDALNTNRNTMNEVTKYKTKWIKRETLVLEKIKEIVKSKIG